MKMCFWKQFPNETMKKIIYGAEMDKLDFNELYKEMQNEMECRLCVGATAFHHPGTKGDETEDNWIDWLRNYLPKRYAVNRGIIIDSTGMQSDQIDIIVYDKQYSHFVFHHNDSLLIPVESVYAVFEVKQNINKDHLQYASEKAKSVRTLTRTSVPIQTASGELPAKPLHEIIAGILATKYDWAETAVQQVVKNNPVKDHINRLDIVCSLSGGTIITEGNTFVEEYDQNANPTIKFCNKEESLVYLLLSLLKKLQRIGTVPAIDFSKYATGIEICHYKEIIKETHGKTN